jgi:uncharacterized membrane protein
MMYGGYGWGWGWGGWILMIVIMVVFWAALITAVVLAIRYLAYCGSRRNQPSSGPARAERCVGRTLRPRRDRRGRVPKAHNAAGA